LRGAHIQNLRKISIDLVLRNQGPQQVVVIAFRLHEAVLPKDPQHQVPVHFRVLDKPHPPRPLAMSVRPCSPRTAPARGLEVVFEQTGVVYNLEPGHNVRQFLEVIIAGVERGTNFHKIFGKGSFPWKF
jgi:hypothetical protein